MIRGFAGYGERVADAGLDNEPSACAPFTDQQDL
jgi:hypothetical protein